jgi:hypothetical protein
VHLADLTSKIYSSISKKNPEAEIKDNDQKNSNPSILKKKPEKNICEIVLDSAITAPPGKNICQSQRYEKWHLCLYYFIVIKIINIITIRKSFTTHLYQFLRK